MSEGSLTLDTFFENWKLYQDGLRDAVRPLTEEQLALRVAPGLRTAGEIAAHIIEARVGWFNGYLGEDVGELAPLSEWGTEGSPARTESELVYGLDASWKMVSDALARWGSAGLEYVITRHRDGRQHTPRSRAWVIWHLLEHDLHHGGELSLTLGAHGLQAPDI